MGRFTRLVVGGVFALLVFASSAAALSAEGVFTGRGNTWIRPRATTRWAVTPTLVDAVRQRPLGRLVPPGWGSAGSGSTRTGSAGRGDGSGSSPRSRCQRRCAATRTSSSTTGLSFSESAGSLVNTPHFWEYSRRSRASGCCSAASTGRPGRRGAGSTSTTPPRPSGRLLDSFDGGLRRGTILVGQVNGDWAVWSKVSNRGSDWSVFRHRISTDTPNASRGRPVATTTRRR